MTDTKERLPEEKEPHQKDPEPQIQLSPEFYMDLLDLPTCKTIGVCSNCNRCER